MDLNTPVADAGRMFKMYARRLEKLGITKLEDFLYHTPSRYVDYSLVSPIAQVQPGEVVTIRGEVIEMKNEYTRNRKIIQKGVVEDESGSIQVIWFNQPYLTRVIQKGNFISLSGKVDFFAHKIVMESPDYEVITDPSQQGIHTGRIIPIYPETHGVSSKWLRRQIYKIIKENSLTVKEFLPEELKNKHSLMNLITAFEQVHFPESLEIAHEAKKRLAYDELLLLQLASLKRKREWEQNLQGHLFFVSKFKPQIEGFWEQLPFELTNAQKRAVQDIFKDLASKKPMNRLLEGDVGSGKTVVGAIAMYLAHLNSFQSVLMAPTEILAQQHYNTIFNLLNPLGVKVGLQTGSKKSITNPLTPTLSLEGRGSVKTRVRVNKARDTRGTLDTRDTFSYDILIGTHAVLSKNVGFSNLGLVVIDEQQRFGVEQRSIIRQKGENPHLLTMTATPIPRTVALTMYGDLDLSYLDEMPKGRKIIKTWLVSTEKRENAYMWIEKQILETDSQAFIICPFIEESENMTTVKAATKEYERLQNEVFPHLKLGLLHGRQKGKEKDEVLKQFKNKEIHILVATPVVEVGIDIPNATIMLIEASERFGLAQLHQLRGRVGRGEKQSYCLLFTESKSEQTQTRLKAMETMQVGAELAELDLRLRGPGDIFGTMQHGLPRLKVASFSDFPLIEKARRDGQNVFQNLSKYPELEKKVQKVTVSTVSPD